MTSQIWFKCSFKMPREPKWSQLLQSCHLPQIGNTISLSTWNFSHHIVVRKVLFAERPNEVMVTLCQQLESSYSTVLTMLWKMKVIQHSKSADSELLSQNHHREGTEPMWRELKFPVRLYTLLGWLTFLNMKYKVFNSWKNSLISNSFIHSFKNT